MTSINLRLEANALKTDDSTFQARIRRLFIIGLHGGVNPDFREASRDLYFRELRVQLLALERFNTEVHTRPLRARLQLILSLRSSRLVRYSRTHWVELNECQPNLLVQLQQRISAIRAVRRSIVAAKRTDAINALTLEIERVPTFRLMQRLGQEGLKHVN
ncbi:MAG: hypothetical protein CMD33_03990 [Flavobacteriales bacterium]|nr:hypothetical protein [Flavobacteriales bacterium]